jgi:N-carbamoylputrescine amidase
MKIGLVQQRISQSSERNSENLINNIVDCAKKGASLVVLSELHNSVYFCQTENSKNFDLAESIPGPSTDAFGKLSKELGIVLVTSLFEKRGPGIYHNTAVVIDKGVIVGKYRKMHIPDDPGYYEKFYFTPGDLGFEPIDTSVGKLGVLICWDQWFPEAARLMAMKGADMLIYPTAIGWDITDNMEEQQKQLDSWINIQRSHAIANGLFVISANRIGYEIDPSMQTKGIDFWGNSFIAGPQGELEYTASVFEEENPVIEIDKTKIETTRRTWPFFRDRRIDAYGKINSLFLS